MGQVRIGRTADIVLVAVDGTAAGLALPTKSAPRKSSRINEARDWPGRCLQPFRQCAKRAVDFA